MKLKYKKVLFFVLTFILVFHYTSQVHASEHKVIRAPSCEYGCTHNIEIEICDNISLADLLSGSNLFFLNNRDYLWVGKFIQRDCFSYDTPYLAYNGVSSQELARSHI